MEPLSKQLSIINYSRRYHRPNTSIKEEQDYSMDQHVNDLIRLIEYLPSRPVNLVGHSYGALIALELLCLKPELVNKAVLIEPPAIRLFVSNVPKPLEILKLLVRRPKTAFAIIKLGATGIGPATAAARKGDLQKAFELFGKAALGGKTFEQMSQNRREQAFENLCPQELLGSGFLAIDQEKLKKMPHQVLFLSGSESPPVYKYLIKRLLECIPGSISQQIEHASHIVQEDNPEAFNLAVLSFLD